MKQQACDLEHSLERIYWKGLSYNGEAGNGGGYFKCQGMRGERYNPELRCLWDIHENTSRKKNGVPI